MAHELFGTFTCPLDEKYRAVLPAKMRDSVTPDELKAGFWITRGFEGCLMMFLNEDWKKLTRKVEMLPFTNDEVRTFKRFFLTPALPVTCDRVGRLGLADSHREMAGIERELIFNGGGSYIEIWSPERWDKFCREKLPDFERVAAKHLDGLFSGLPVVEERDGMGGSGKGGEGVRA